MESNKAVPADPSAIDLFIDMLAPLLSLRCASEEETEATLEQIRMIAVHVFGVGTIQRVENGSVIRLDEKDAAILLMCHWLIPARSVIATLERCPRSDDGTYDLIEVSEQAGKMVAELFNPTKEDSEND